MKRKRFECVASCRLQARHLFDIILDPDKTGRNKHQIAFQHLIAALDLCRPVRRHVDKTRMHSLEDTLFQIDRLHRRFVTPRIMSFDKHDLLLTVIRLFDLRPFRPRIVLATRFRRLRQHFQLDNIRAAKPHDRTAAVIARIASADNDHLFAVQVGKGNVKHEPFRDFRKKIDRIVHPFDARIAFKYRTRLFRPRA